MTGSYSPELLTSVAAPSTPAPAAADGAPAADATAKGGGRTKKAAASMVGAAVGGALGGKLAGGLGATIGKKVGEVVGGTLGTIEVKIQDFEWDDDDGKEGGAGVVGGAREIRSGWLSEAAAARFGRRGPAPAAAAAAAPAEGEAAAAAAGAAAAGPGEGGATGSLVVAAAAPVAAGAKDGSARLNPNNICLHAFRDVAMADLEVTRGRPWKATF